MGKLKGRVKRREVDECLALRTLARDRRGSTVDVAAEQLGGQRQGKGNSKDTAE